MNNFFQITTAAACMLLVGCVDQGAEHKASQAGSRLASAASLDFTCDPADVTAETTLRSVVDADGETLALNPTREACQYDLVHRDSHNARVKLSQDPAFFAVTHAQRFGTTEIVCASPIRHHKSQVASSDPSLANRTIDGAALLCAADAGGGFSKMEKLVDGGHDYAAWIADLAPATLPPRRDGDDHGDDDGSAAVSAFAATWVRDSTFQFLNLSNGGRPSTDGIYQTVFTVDARGRVRAVATTKVSDDISTVDAVAGG